MVTHQSFTACFHVSQTVPNSLSLYCICAAAAENLLTGTLTMETLPCYTEVLGEEGNLNSKVTGTSAYQGRKAETSLVPWTASPDTGDWNGTFRLHRL